MDSLTQIVLGAACGEAVLGKKIGNKALMFGAVGGTVPDFDVFVGNWIYSNTIDAMLFHRGFMHSIVFAVVAASVIGWLVYKLYNTGKRKSTTTLNDWMLLFFLALFTHPLLDCFTPYGTQLFAPFSNYRVAFNTIAVADPFYTLPFLVCIITLMFYNRKSRKRSLFLSWGLALSSAYLCFTVCNKMYINSVFEASLKANQILAKRYSTQPAILSNVLWFAVAETPNAYLVANYSLFDKKNRFINFKELPKQRHILPKQFKELERLAWFSNGYYNVYSIDSENYQYNDLRYPILETETRQTPVFSFTLYKDGKRLNMKPFKAKFENFDTVLSSLWQRLKGV